MTTKSAVHEKLMKKHKVLGKSFEPVKPLSTGSIMLDVALGIGGWPRGRVIEIFGAESSGKSTLAYMAIKSAQRAGDLFPVLLDFECTFDPLYAERMGIDTSDDVFQYYRPATLEIGADILETYIRADIPIIGVIDSVAAMLPDSHAQGEIGDEKRVGAQAQRLGQVLRRLIPQVYASDSILMYVNHIQDVIETGFGAGRGGRKTTTPGGRALKFYSSARVELSLREGIKSKMIDPETGKEEEVVGARKVQARCIKNKVAAPWKSATFIMRPPFGIVDMETIIDVGIARGIIGQSGARFKMPEFKGEAGPNLHGKAQVMRYLLDDVNRYSNLRSLVVDTLKNTSGVPANLVLDNVDRELVEVGEVTPFEEDEFESPLELEEELDLLRVADDAKAGLVTL